MIPSEQDGLSCCVAFGGNRVRVPVESVVAQDPPCCCSGVALCIFPSTSTCNNGGFVRSSRFSRLR